MSLCEGAMNVHNTIAQLASEDPKQLQEGLTSLTNLVSQQQVAESVLSDMSTTRILLTCAKSDRTPFDRLSSDIIAQALSNSGCNYRNALLNIVRFGGIASIVSVLNNNSLSIKPITVSLIKEMTYGADQKNVQYVPTICNELYYGGVVPPLVQVLSLNQGVDSKTKIRVMKALGTLSLHCGEQVLCGGAIGAVLDYLYEGGFEGQLVAVETLGIFTQVSATEVLSCGSVGPLLRLLRGPVEIQKRVLQVLLLMCEFGDPEVLLPFVAEQVQDYLIICTEPEARLLAARFLSNLTRQCRKKILRKDLVPIVMAVLDGSYNPKLRSGSPRSLAEISSSVMANSSVSINPAYIKSLTPQGSGVSAASESSAGAATSTPVILQQQPILISSEPCYFSGKDLQLDDFDFDMDIDFDIGDNEIDNLLQM